jgi:hypothetical protein
MSEESGGQVRDSGQNQATCPPDSSLISDMFGFSSLSPNFRCYFDQGYEQTTFHKLTGWGNWLRTNQQLLWGNPHSDGGGPLK